MALSLIIVISVSSSSCDFGVTQKGSYCYNNEVENKSVRVNIEEAKTLSKITALNQSIIFLSQLSLEKNIAYRIKAMSNNLKKDNIHINNQLNNLAEKKLILLPNSLDEKQRNALSNMDDGNFSEVYLDKVEELLKSEIKQLQYLSAITNDVDFKVLTVKVLVKLNYNLNQITKIESLTI
ncbi:DUF4142 domain-containing protein [Mariniflexile sp.]|uniref:DUF4142 domain-containing protein n=1 Tax=Mariniflexile sp. TaxID=1979402 RepID=UPI0040488EC2